MTTYWLLGKIGFSFRIQVSVPKCWNSRRYLKKEFDNVFKNELEEAKNGDGSSYGGDIEELEGFVNHQFYSNAEEIMFFFRNHSCMGFKQNDDLETETERRLGNGNAMTTWKRKQNDDLETETERRLSEDLETEPERRLPEDLETETEQRFSEDLKTETERRHNEAERQISLLLEDL